MLRMPGSDMRGIGAQASPHDTFHLEDMSIQSSIAWGFMPSQYVAHQGVLPYLYIPLRVATSQPFIYPFTSGDFPAIYISFTSGDFPAILQF